MDNTEALSVTDAESIQTAVLQLILKYPGYPAFFEPSFANVKWNDINTDTSIGLYALPGAVYLKRYIYGGYKAQFFFAVRYRSSPQSTPACSSSQIMLENLAKWLESCHIQFTDKKIKMESIVRTSQVYGPSQDENSMDCAVNLRVIFEQEE